MFDKIRYILLLILVTLVSVSYHPYVYDISIHESLEKGTILTPIIYIVYILLLIITLNIKDITKSRTIKKLFYLILLFSLTLFVLSSFFINVNLLINLRSILIPFFAICIGWCIKINEKQLKSILLIFVLVVLYTILMQIMKNIGSFVILDYYATSNKNSLGGIAASAAIVASYLFISNKNNKILNIAYITLTILLIISLLTIRARAATLAAIFVIFYTHFLKMRKIKANTIFITMILLFFIYLILPDNAIDYVYNSFFQNKEHNITSGRSDIMKKGLNFILNNPLFGNMNGTAPKIGNRIHNYILIKFFDLGLIGGFFVLLFYFTILFKTIKESLSKDIFEVFNVGYILLIAPFIISFVEPSFPFGPGTVNVFNFILFGVALKYTNKPPILPNN